MLINFVGVYKFSLLKKLILLYKSRQNASNQEIGQISKGD